MVLIYRRSYSTNGTAMEEKSQSSMVFSTVFEVFVEILSSLSQMSLDTAASVPRAHTGQESTSYLASQLVLL